MPFHYWSPQPYSSWVALQQQLPGQVGQRPKPRHPKSSKAREVMLIMGNRQHLSFVCSKMQSCFWWFQGFSCRKVTRKQLLPGQLFLKPEVMLHCDVLNNTGQLPVTAAFWGASCPPELYLWEHLCPGRSEQDIFTWSTCVYICTFLSFPHLAQCKFSRAERVNPSTNHLVETGRKENSKGQTTKTSKNTCRAPFSLEWIWALSTRSWPQKWVSITAEISDTSSKSQQPHQPWVLHKGWGHRGHSRWWHSKHLVW